MVKDKKYVLYFLIIFVSTPLCKAENKDQHVHATLRAIGHEFLLQMGDSTSRVLPIKKENSRYKIEFEKEFAFEPFMLSFAVHSALDQTKIIESYIVEVETCVGGEVVYSYEVSSAKDDSALPCQYRALPKGCYAVYLTSLEVEMPVKQEEGGAWAIGKTAYVLSFLVMSIGLALFLVKKKNSVKPNPDLIHIGRYRFDQKAMVLTLRAESIALSSKESDLLVLLFSNENKTLEREYILNVVWGDAGDYVGRTLDVFISKLRKKLEADPSVKIINVRGVGYRFVIN